VCPVHINIAEQITLWRQHMVRIKASKPSLHYAFNVAGKLFGSPKWFRRAKKLGYYGLKLAPDWLVYNKTLNAWGKNRQMPAIQKETFRDWYIKNRVK